VPIPFEAALPRVEYEILLAKLMPRKSLLETSLFSQRRRPGAYGLISKDEKLGNGLLFDRHFAVGLISRRALKKEN
jgi:hypothetical protein